MDWSEQVMLSRCSRLLQPGAWPAGWAPAVGLSLSPASRTARRPCLGPASLRLPPAVWLWPRFLLERRAGQTVPTKLSALTFYSCVPPGLADSLGIKVRNLGTPTPGVSGNDAFNLQSASIILRNTTASLSRDACPACPPGRRWCCSWAVPAAPHPRL